MAGNRQCHSSLPLSSGNGGGTSRVGSHCKLHGNMGSALQDNGSRRVYRVHCMAGDQRGGGIRGGDGVLSRNPA